MLTSYSIYFNVVDHTSILGLIENLLLFGELMWRMFFLMVSVLNTLLPVPFSCLPALLLLNQLVLRFSFKVVHKGPADCL